VEEKQKLSSALKKLQTVSQNGKSYTIDLKNEYS
jgi:hypothetical protein